MNGPQLLACVAVAAIVLVIAFFLNVMTNVVTLGLGLLLAASVIGALKAVGLSMP